MRIPKIAVVCLLVLMGVASAFLGFVLTFCGIPGARSLYLAAGFLGGIGGGIASMIRRRRK